MSVSGGNFNFNYSNSYNQKILNNLDSLSPRTEYFYEQNTSNNTY